MKISVKVSAALTSAEAHRFGWVRWLTLNNRRQSVGPKPDSRPRLEGACYKYLTCCSRLLSPSSPFSCTHHQPDSSTQWVSAMGMSQKGLRVWVQSRLDPCPKEQQQQQQQQQRTEDHFLQFSYSFSVVCRSITTMSPAKTAELIKMVFEMWTLARPRKVLDGGPDPHRWIGNFDGERGPAQDMSGSL